MASSIPQRPSRFRTDGAAMAAHAASAFTLALTAALCGCSGNASDKEQAPAPTARVQTASAASGSLSPIATAYGTAVSAPAHTHIIVMPYEGAITGVAVHAGDSVSADQVIATVARTPATAAQFTQAHSALSFAQQDLLRVQRLYADKLASNEQLAAARKALADAQAQLDAFNSSGADQERSALRAPFPGVITRLTATPGERPTPGSAIATVSSQGDMIVQLGLEPADAATLAPGAPIRLLRAADDAAPINTKLVAIGKAQDSASHLVNAVAPLPPADSARVMLGSTLMAQVQLPARQGVIVPRGALLEDAAGPYVFMLIAGKARRQAVRIGAETDQSALIIEGLAADARVIVAGNAGLEDGIAVTESTP
ncbi:MAG: efflux RND transporter periplasmic adaptor subunit [Steroidobacterales bacterium]